MASKALPFPRGKTLGDSLDNLTLSDTWYQHLEGKEFEVEDTIHGTGEKVILRVVKNDSGAAITVARRACRWSTGAEDFGKRVAGFVNSQGIHGAPLDDKYSEDSVTSIPDDDLFYVVVKGPVKVNTEATAVNLTAHDPVVWDASGYIDGVKAQHGYFSPGVVDQAATTTATATLIYVDCQGAAGVFGT